MIAPVIMKNYRWILILMAVLLGAGISYGSSIRDEKEQQDKPVRALSQSEVDSLIIRMKERSGEPYGEWVKCRWEYVAASVDSSRNVVWKDEKCPQCGGDLVEHYYTSPPETWMNLAGRAGDLVICPHCMIQTAFYLYVLN